MRDTPKKKQVQIKQSYPTTKGTTDWIYDRRCGQYVKYCNSTGRIVVWGNKK